MTDQEVICEFMEPRPTPLRNPSVGKSKHGWWEIQDVAWLPATLALDRLREVEARVLQDSTMREQYFWQMAEILYGEKVWPGGVTEYLALLHASADQKIKALASVLREAAND